MRPVHLVDLDAGTRALLACEESQRHALALRLVQEARAADSYRKRLRRQHPQFGSGTLRSAAQSYPAAQTPAYCDANYMKCMVMLLIALLGAETHHRL